MKKLRLLLPCAFAATIWAQTTSFPLALKQFLDLTDAQILQIGKFSDSYNQTLREKQIRMTQLQFEIAQETAKEPIDPMELGVRYTEVAQIQKDLRNGQTNLRTSVRQVLTDAQKAKVKALDDAMKLQPLISEATCVGFIDPALIRWFDTSGFAVSNVGTFTRGGIVGDFLIGGCIAGSIGPFLPAEAKKD